MKNKSLFILILLFNASIFANGIELVSPINNFNAPEFTINFIWNPVSSQTTYKLQIAQDAGFTNILSEYVINQTNQRVTFPHSTSTVFWKVESASGNGFIESDVYTLSFINPSQNPNVFLWLSADSNVVLNPDSTISAWNNIIPNGISAIQPTAGKQPLLKANTALLNNKNVVRFDGSNDELFTTGGGPVGSLFTVFNYSAGAVFNNYNGFITNRTITVFDDYYITAALPGSTNFEPQDYFSPAPAKGKMFINQATFPTVNTGYSLAPLINFKIFGGIRLATIKTGVFNIGNEGGQSRFWQGDTPEIIFSTSNSETGADSIQTYLQNRYAPPVTIKDTVLGTSFCTPVSISAPNNYTSYLWSTGATTASINVTPNNTYTLTTKDIFGKESTTAFHVFPYVRLNNTSVAICKGDTFKVDLKLPSGYSALWNTGATTSRINITTSGIYSVKITDNNGCFVFDSVTVILDDPILFPTPNATNNLSLCLNEKLYLNTNTAIDSILWSTGSSNPFITIVAPGDYNVYARTIAGCVLNQSFKINIAGEAPVANFINTSPCQNAPISFTDISTTSNVSTITSWKWTFGNGNVDSVANPSNIYTNIGSYTIGFKVVTNQGCSDSISKAITVNRNPLPVFYNLQSCAGIPTTFVDQSLANSAALTDWTWDFDGLGSVNSIKNPSFLFPSAGTYEVELTVTNSNNCKDSLTVPISVNKSPVSNFSFDLVCGKSPVNFQYLATIEPPATLTTHQWDFGDGTFESTIKNAQHPYNEPGTYDVKLIVRSSDQCVDTLEKQVKVFDFPVVDFDVSQTQCIGKEIQFTDISATPDGTPITSWNWFFAGQGSSTQQNPSFTFNNEGNYTIQLNAKNAVGCSGTKLRSIAVTEPPVPAFTFSPQNGLPPLTVTYVNQSPVSGNYIWDYGDGSLPFSGYTPPPHVYNTIGTYPIKLIATNFRGCTDTLTKLILVDKAVLDAVMTSVTVTPDGEYFQVQVTVINNSNVEIRALGLALQLGAGSQIVEDWEGSLLPGQTLKYTFTGQIKLGDNSTPLVCATIDNVNNNSVEDRTDNNSTCKELAVGNFDILNIYPNPAYETINFGIMLPKDGRVNIRFIDVLGQIMYNKDFDGLRGYNNFPMTTMPLNAAVYVAEVLYDGQIIRQKFMRKDRK